MAWAAIEKLRLGVSDPVEWDVAPADAPTDASATTPAAAALAPAAYPEESPAVPPPRKRDVFARWPLGDELVLAP